MKNQEKVYLIAEGSYSSYGIKAVFKNRAKAEKYVKYHPGTSIEEYFYTDDAWDVAEGDKRWRAYMCFSVYRQPDHSYTISVQTQHTIIEHIDIGDPEVSKTDKENWTYAGKSFGVTEPRPNFELSITRLFPESRFETEREVRKTMEKIGYDFCTRISDFIENELDGEINYYEFSDLVDTFTDPQ